MCILTVFLSFFSIAAFILVPKVYRRLFQRNQKAQIIWGNPEEGHKINNVDGKIPIIVTIDNNYTLQTLVLVTSLAQTAEKSTSYNIIILTSADYKEENKSKI